MLPLLDNIPTTKVPELADVIKNVATRIKHITVVIVVNGNMPIRSQSAIDILFIEESAKAQLGVLNSTEMEAPPNIVIHAKLPSGGISREPATSSLIVLP